MLTLDTMMQAFTPKRNPYQRLLGFEYEVFCFHGDTLAPLAYDEPGGLRDLLEAAARLTGGTVVHVAGEPVTKVELPDDGLLSLEPGGQFEFSSPPKGLFQETVDQLGRHVALLGELRRQFGLHFFYGGVNPVHRLEDIGLVTRTRRYQIMDRCFQALGTMGQRMMRQTCSVHVTFDYRDQTEGEELLRTAFYLSPFVAAMFSNSPYLEGRRTGYRSYRVPIWANTDPSRCGLVPGFTAPEFDFSAYIRYVLRAPMFFVSVDDDLVPAEGLTFDKFTREGFLGRTARLEDFLLHNSTIFTDVRLKHTVEVRSVDAQQPAMMPALLALLSGLLFCERSRNRVLRLLSRFDALDYATLPDRLSQEGLRAVIKGVSAAEVAEELIALAAQGLPTCFPDGAAAAEQLDPLRSLVHQRKTPADVVLERFGESALAWLADTSADGETPPGCAPM